MWSLFNLQMGLASLTFARKSYFLRLYHSRWQRKDKVQVFKSLTCLSKGLPLTCQMCSAARTAVWGGGRGWGRGWHPALASCPYPASRPLPLLALSAGPHGCTGHIGLSDSLNHRCPVPDGEPPEGRVRPHCPCDPNRPQGDGSNSQSSERTNALLPLGLSSAA